MATYREIKGLTVPYLDADLPSASASTQEGSVWYNSGTGKLRAFLSYDTWATSASLNIGRDYLSGFGTQTAAIAAAGYTGPGTVRDEVEEYNGSGWSETTDLNTARRLSQGNGTSTAGLVVGGQSSTATVAIAEEFNGSTWSEKGDLNTARRNMGNAMQGTTEAALVFGGDPPSTLDVCEQFNGTSWTEVGDLNTAREKNKGTGTSTAALSIGGSPDGGGGSAANVESWDNSSWTEVGDLNTGKQDGAAAGSSTAAIYFGGGGGTQQTELWDGSSWTETTDLSTARGVGSGGAGTVPAALSFAGGPGDISATEEFNKSILTFTPGSWATGGNLPGNLNSLTQFGTQTAAATAGGELGGAENTESYFYDGSSWTAGADQNTTRVMLVSAGTQTSGIIAAGYSQPAPTRVVNLAETYDGSSWTEIADLNTGRGYLGSSNAGTQTALVAFGGLINPELNPSPFGAVGEKNESEEWNGSAWTEGNNLNTARWYTSGAGIQTAALCIAGNISHPSGTSGAVVEQYNGTSWSEIADVSTVRQRSMAFGTTASALAIGGGPSPIATVEAWDGTVWSTSPSLNAAKTLAGGSGTTAAGLVSGGQAPATNTTDEWTGETTAAEAADIDFD